LVVSRLIFFAFILAVFCTQGCAYHFGLRERVLPGGYTEIAIPVFKNRTGEVGIETMFTNALVRRFERSKVAKVLDKDSAPVVVEGTIMHIETFASAPVDSTKLTPLPADAVLDRVYRIVVTSNIVLKRKSDERIIWQGNFSNERVYDPPRLGTGVVNSANATYNQSARMEYMSRLAEEMMTEAHDRITENF
jgi:hypothetical protein